MTAETWVAFVLASAAVLAIPGPTLMLVIGQSLTGGRGRALPLVAGVALGDFTALSLSLLGLGALLAASSLAFTVLKWAGAAYLVWLGVRMWRAPVEGTAAGAVNPGRAFRDAYVVTALNPKSIAFFVAFVPQFVSPSMPFGPQAVLLVLTFVALAALNALAYALLAIRLAGAVARPKVRCLLQRVGGGMLVGAGIATAAMRRA
jgi:threonine/homoserine/homoserine lactone efflux protein